MYSRYITRSVITTLPCALMNCVYTILAYLSWMKLCVAKHLFCNLSYAQSPILKLPTTINSQPRCWSTVAQSFTHYWDLAAPKLDQNSKTSPKWKSGIMKSSLNKNLFHHNIKLVWQVRENIIFFLTNLDKPSLPQIKPCTHRLGWNRESGFNIF
jgi:hypothetical protein